MAEGTLDPSDLGPGTPVPGPGETPGRSLDERSSGIDTNTQIGERDSLRIILRSARLQSVSSSGAMLASSS